jgi:putative membrane-bound dehydrogenase-like protein
LARLKVCVLAALLMRSCLQAAEEGASRLEAPASFIVEPVAGPEQVRFPMFATLDEQGRLYVAESSGLDLYAELAAQTRRCRVSRLEDRDGDGRYEHSQVFADGLVFPMGLVWRDGQLYVADPPDLVVCEDRDDDGRSDSRQVILTGFGHTDNGSLHGLEFGPDGWLYMTMGEPDGYRLKRSDGSILAGTNGALLRVRPDGRDPEVVSRGFTNLVEVVFLPDGSIIGTDNWFQLPNGGLRDALVHLVEGGHYPPNSHHDHTEHVHSGELLPPVTRLPATGISGLVRYRGQQFPAPMRGNLFSAQHNTRKIQRHVLLPRGASWISEDIDFVTTEDPDFHPSDVLEDADGTLLVVDTGAWYVQHCPTGRIQRSAAEGGIYRVRCVAAHPTADAWGTGIDWPSLSVEQLLALLADERPRVADRAQRQLEQHAGDVASLLAQWVAGRPPDESRQRAVWLLAQRGDEASLRLLRSWLIQDDPELAAAAARGLSLGPDREAAPPLVALLSRPDAATRMAAAGALSHCGRPEDVQALWAALAEPSDPFLSHALTWAISRLARADDLQAALANRSPRIQQAALILLDQPPHKCLTPHQVVPRLHADDEALRRTALEILLRHAEWASSARRLIDDLVTADTLSAEQSQTLRSLVLAFQQRPEVTFDIGRAIAGQRPELTADRRCFLLDTLAESASPAISAACAHGIGRALNDADSKVRLSAVRAAMALDLSEHLVHLTELSERESTDPGLRLDLLRAVTRHRRHLSEASTDWLLDRIADDMRPLDQLASAEILARIEIDTDQVIRLLELARDRLLISPMVLMPVMERSAGGAAGPAVAAFLDARLATGWRPTEETLAGVVARLNTSQAAAGESIMQNLRAARARQAGELSALLPLVASGDPARGRAVFFSPEAACAVCHRVGDEGGNIGPDLTRIGVSRSARDLVESVVAPSSTIAQGYETYTIETVDGAVYSGILARQTLDVVVLIDSARNESRFKRVDIEVMTRSSVSLMPDGIVAKLTSDQLADLLAWLVNLR